MIFRNRRIIYRIGLVIGIFCLLMIGLAVWDFLSIRKINTSLEQLVNRTYVKVELAQDLRFLARHKAVLIRNILLLEDRAAKQFELQRIRQEEIQYEETLARLTSFIEKSEEKILLDRVTKARNATTPLWDRVLRLGMEGRTDEAIKLLTTDVRTIQWEWLDNLNAMVELQKEYARSNYTATLSTSSGTLEFLVLINVFAVGIGLVLAMAISRSIIGPLTDFTRKVEKIAHGDLSVQVDYDTNDEIGVLGENINRMVRMRKKNLEELEAYRLHLEELVEERTGELNRQREEFLSVLIHDLKGPVTPILGFTRRLIKGKAKNREDSLTCLKAIEDSSRQLLATIERISRDLREKSALDVFNPEKFDILDMARCIARSFLPRIEEKDLALRINKLEEANWETLGPGIFTGDPGQMKTLIENLLGNAVKYAERLINLDMEITGGTLELSVSDDGPGIAIEYQEKIFEQYYQIPGSLKGTGIGLYSVLKVVENHKGSITVNSRPEHGATFRVVLPGMDA
jgi:signal transduction histidine kinase